MVVAKDPDRQSPCGAGAAHAGYVACAKINKNMLHNAGSVKYFHPRGFGRDESREVLNAEGRHGKGKCAMSVARRRLLSAGTERSEITDRNTIQRRTNRGHDTGQMCLRHWTNEERLH